MEQPYMLNDVSEILAFGQAYCFVLFHHISSQHRSDWFPFFLVTKTALNSEDESDGPCRGLWKTFWSFWQMYLWYHIILKWEWQQNFVSEMIGMVEIMMLNCKLSEYPDVHPFQIDRCLMTEYHWGFNQTDANKVESLKGRIIE